MLRKIFMTAIAVSLLIGALVYAKLGQFSAMGRAAEAMAVPPETVTAVTVDEALWERSIAAVGTLEPVQGVMVSAEVGGRVTRIDFASGAAVKAGDVLLRLDTSSEEAQLASAEAAATLAKADLTRVRAMDARKLSSQDALDAAEAKAKETQAQVVNMRALIAKKTVRAPFGGRLGLRLVNLGQVLQEGDRIVSLQTLDPIYVDFSIPQQRLGDLRHDMTVRVRADAAPDETFSGAIIAVSPEVDAVTRSVRVRAQIANPGERLRAGMFARVEVVLQDRQPVLPVPATAVLYAPYGDSVFVIEERKNDTTGATEPVLRQQFVRLGRARGDFVDVTDGLKAGETVVTSGVFKLRTGMTVVIDNRLAPAAGLEPNPSDS
ncbi:efflux RND transporter periplasmic adaptor subunit [Allochromatium tepidum]|uniref:MexH family multidrug efflux RND transporter periplasmic adaptor subunit n=1 Tax=Allochromatium tepidum TaxID=553982 RepID=A0ABN6G787_9GAMM|nr:efflux RND transporter periplasmic adaptor subunit [Allochromatium tepidum]BCU05827.1 MexH family multidrug efflux RND transporter periplasmic adaptor subunit [Allochromatium tepidum]